MRYFKAIDYISGRERKNGGSIVFFYNVKGRNHVCIFIFKKNIYRWSYTPHAVFDHCSGWHINRLVWLRKLENKLGLFELSFGFRRGNENHPLPHPSPLLKKWKKKIGKVLKVWNASSVADVFVVFMMWRVEPFIPFS